MDVTLTERPDVDVKASITRIAGELDPRTRMMLCEVDVPNKDNFNSARKLCAGTFQQPAGHRP